VDGNVWIVEAANAQNADGTGACNGITFS
jgi:hypothetical protein